MTQLDAVALARWKAHPTTFVGEVLHNPETKKPFVLLDAERRFFEHAWRTGADGRLLYPEQVYSCPKKSGKTTTAAMHMLTTVLLFGGSYPEGVALANDFDQAQGRVFEMVRRICECSPLLRAEARITAERITFPAIDATITAVASDYSGAAGGAQNIAVFDELWGYTSERSYRLWDEMVPVPTRKIACRLSVTYAGFSDDSALLETLYKRGSALPLVGPDLHAGDGLLMFWSHDPVAPWQTAAWIEQMRRSLRPNQFLRMIENRLVTSESTITDMAGWARCNAAKVRPLAESR